MWQRKHRYSSFNWDRKEGRNLTLGSKEALFLWRSSSTLWRISVGMFLASNVAISSLTPRLARKLQKKKKKKTHLAVIHNNLSAHYLRSPMTHESLLCYVCNTLNFTLVEKDGKKKKHYWTSFIMVAGIKQAVNYHFVFIVNRQSSVDTIWVLEHDNTKIKDTLRNNQCLKSRKSGSC